MSEGVPRRRGGMCGRLLGLPGRIVGLLDDPHGLLAFAIVAGVLVSYLTIDPGRGPYLFSESLFLEVLGHVWLLLGPPLGVAISVRHFIHGGTGVLPLVTVPLGGFLTLAGFGGVLLGAVLTVLG